jgi:beta-glucanase (GH16 family)
VPPKPGGGRWQCSFDDEFDSHSGDAQALNTAWWTPQTTSTSGYNTGTAGDALACYVDTPETIAVSGGALRLRVEKLAEPVQCGTFSTQYVAGMVTTVNGFSQTYGRFEVRARIPRTSVPGLQETLWLWPKNSARYGSAWPDSGEVDFAEFFSSKADLDVPNIHYNYDPATIDATTHTNLVTAYCPIDPARYNDYAVVWSPGNFTITVDGNICLIDNYTPDQGLTTPQPFDQPFFIALTQALGVGGNAFDPARTPLPATTSIDYVRAWN